MSQTNYPQPLQSLLDRRNAKRVSFGARISIAIVTGDSIPPDDCFQLVKAVDLSQTGISFRMNRWPSSDQLLVRFSDQAGPVHATARVVECCRDDADSPDGRFEVRCEFAEWLGEAAADRKATSD